MADLPPMPLQGKRVVVTRAAEQSAGLVQALRERGAEPILLPLVAFEPPGDLSALDAALRRLGEFDWILLTSQNAVRALHERSAALDISLSAATAGARIGAVGQGTADSAREAGLSVTYVATKQQGTFLARELAVELKGKRVFLPRSNKANPELVEVLKNLGALVTEVAAYKTVSQAAANQEASRLVLAREVDAILFFSPSAVHHLEELLGTEKFVDLSRRAVFAAIGPVTGEALRQSHASRMTVSPGATIHSILDALAESFSQPDAKLPAGAQLR